MNNNILLESGTGELEVIEFVANNCHYAINVVKNLTYVHTQENHHTKRMVKNILFIKI